MRYTECDSVITYNSCTLRSHRLSTSCSRYGLRPAIGRRRRRRRHVWVAHLDQSTNTASASVIRRRRPPGTTRRRAGSSRRHRTASRSELATYCASPTCATRTRARPASASWLTAPACRPRRSATGSRIADRGTEPLPPRTGARDVTRDSSACMTRSYAIADKPRDAFVQYAMAWLTP